MEISEHWKSQLYSQTTKNPDHLVQTPGFLVFLLVQTTNSIQSSFGQKSTLIKQSDLISPLIKQSGRQSIIFNIQIKVGKK